MNYNALWNEWNYYFAKLPNLLLALIVLFVGWLLAKGITKALEKILQKTNVDQKAFPETVNQKYSITKIVSKVVYYILLVFVFILFFNILNLSIIAAPLVSMLSGITTAIPNILKAALILLLGWIIASVLKVAIRKLGKTLKFGALLQKLNIAKNNDEANKLIDSASKIVFYLVLLIFLPGVLSALELTGISEPFAGMIDNLLAFVPKIFAAAIILLVGWIIAKIVRDIVTNFLQSIGVEKVTQRFGFTKLFEGTSFSSVIGTIIYVLILIPTVIATLDRLDINGISEPAISMLNNILTMLPNIAVAIILVLIGVWLGKWIGAFVNNLLSRLGFDSILKNMGIGRFNPEQTKVSLSQLVGYIVQIIIVLLFVIESLQLIQLHFLVTLASKVIAYLPSLFAAILILAVGLLLGNVIQRLLSNILQGNGFQLLGSIAKYTIITLSLFMALDQLGIAASIVSSAFILLLGGLALAFGIAFGLGGKEFAAKYLHKLDQKIDKASTDIEKN